MEKRIVIGKAYEFQGEQWYGAQIGDNGPRMVGRSPAYALGELLAVYPNLVAGHPIATKHSYPDPAFGYRASAPSLKLELVVSAVEPVAVGMLVMGFAELFGIELAFVDRLPQKPETPASSCHSDGPCTSH